MSVLLLFIRRVVTSHTFLESRTGVDFETLNSAVLRSFEKFVTSRDLAVSLLACINLIRI